MNHAERTTAQLASVAAALSACTVQIRTGKSAVGSGVIWHSDVIITNAHVVPGPQATVELADGRTFDAVCTSRDRQRDLAALQIAAKQLLPAATVGDSHALRVGELVLAVGHPVGFAGALTIGIIHSPARNWLRADIRLAPGNSGGPLADTQGRVVGINSVIAMGLALAVPSRVVERFLRQSMEAA